MSEWISVDEQLPHNREFVLAKSTSRFVGVGGRFVGRLILTYSDGDVHDLPYWSNSFYGDTRIEMRNVTHWMPLPAPPEK